MSGAIKNLLQKPNLVTGFIRNASSNISNAPRILITGKKINQLTLKSRFY